MKKFMQYVSHSVAAMMGMSIYILADTYFIATYAGSNGLAVLNLVIPLYGVMNAVGAMIGIGSATRYSIRKARGKDVRSFFLQSLFWIALASIPFMIGGLLFPRNLLALLGANRALQDLGIPYLRCILPFAFFYMASYATGAFVRNDNNPSIAMIGSVSASLFNIVFDYIFMFPLKMGMAGAALATGISPVLSSAICLFHFCSKKNTIPFAWQTPRWKHFCACCQLGLSNFISEMASSVTVATFNFLILNLAGNTGVASYGVITNVSSVCNAMFNGLAQGAQPLMSQSYGKKDVKTLKKYLKYGIFTALCFSVLIVFLVNFQSDFFIGLFNSENSQGLYDYAKQGIRLYFSAFFFVGINTLLVSYFSATNNPKPAFTVSLVRGTFAIVFFAVLLSSLWKMNGIWLAYPSSECVTLFLVLFNYRKEKASARFEKNI